MQNRHSSAETTSGKLSAFLLLKVMWDADVILQPVNGIGGYLNPHGRAIGNWWNGHSSVRCSVVRISIRHQHKLLFIF